MRIEPTNPRKMVTYLLKPSLCKGLKIIRLMEVAKTTSLDVNTNGYTLNEMLQTLIVIRNKNYYYYFHTHQDQKSTAGHIHMFRKNISTNYTLLAITSIIAMMLHCLSVLS